MVVSHNYGRFLGEAIESALLRQCRPPDEIVVISDSSTDNTVSVAKSYGVPVVEIEARSTFASRGEGLKFTQCDVICFLDADDALGPDYLREGLSCFAHDHRVGIVYSNMDRFGDETGRTRYPSFDREALHRDNYIHSGSLVLREALLSSMAFSGGDPGPVEDWAVWRRVVEQGWLARKQSATYFYRRHESCKSLSDIQVSYYDKANLRSETVTLFVPLSGRHKMWRRFRRFLDEQDWPKDQVRLILMDASGSSKFNKRVSNWLFRCQYPDSRLVRFSTGEPLGVADKDRREHQVYRSVQRAVGRIYNAMKSMVETPYVWIVEDDVVPPNDCCERLLREYSDDVVSVSAAIPSRYHEGFIVHRHAPLNLDHTQGGAGVEKVVGNGFGCVIIRREALKDEVFRFDPEFGNGDYDVAFYKRLKTGKKLVNWDVLCQHGP